MFFTRILRSQPKSLTHLVDHYAQYPPTGLTMKRIVDFGRWTTFSPTVEPLMLFSSWGWRSTIVSLPSQWITSSISIDDERNGTPTTTSAWNAQCKSSKWMVWNQSNWTWFIPNFETYAWCCPKVSRIELVFFVVSKFNHHHYRFTEVLQNIRKRHTKVVETLAQVT